MRNDILLESHRDISVRILVLDYNFSITDEISGLAESISFSNDSTSDIRRTASISIVLDSGYTNTGVLNEIYFSAGNGYWFDKYLSISVGVKNEATNNKIEYEPQGVYLINEPSITYDATTNSLSFQAVDLMSKLTGMRSGNLQGIQYQIPANSNIVDVMRDTLIEHGFYNHVLNVPEQATTPFEIKIDSGGTAYDLLSQLRDINPNWEIFFDVSGTFIFQKIPSSEIINGVPEYTPTTIADDAVWDRLLISYDLSTSFEEVKNYIEVYGKTIEPDDIATNVVVDVTNASVSMKLPVAKKSHEYNNYVLFTLGDTEGDRIEWNVPITTLNITDADNVQMSVPCVPNIWYNNMTYMLRIGMDEVEYLGYQQPFAVAWENNKISPFYVGDFAYNNNKLVTNNNEQLITSNGMFLVTSFDASQLRTPTDKIIDNALFTNMVRIVCSGDEYDNIYSNQLAIDRAYYELYQRCRLHDQINITCVPIYSLDVNKVVSITLPNEDVPSYWIIKSITTDFDTEGTQTINAMRYYAEYPANQIQYAQITQPQRSVSSRSFKMMRGGGI